MEPAVNRSGFASEARRDFVSPLVSEVPLYHPLMAYQLVQLKNGTWSVHSELEKETFHPVVGPVAEAEALYVRQLRLGERAAEFHHTEFVIWDIGLGAAANSVTALESLRHRPGKVRMVSFDHSLAPLQFALENSTALGFLDGYEAQVAGLLQTGQIQFQNGSMTVQWETILGDFPTLLASCTAGKWPSPDAILFDAYSPAKNPTMWSLPLFTRLFEVASTGRPCNLATYSRATLLRTTLLLAGWYVGAGEATGEKEETTVAATSPDLIRRPLDHAWLERAHRSTSAEPLRGDTYQQAPLSAFNRERLAAHPQFQ